MSEETGGRSLIKKLSEIMAIVKPIAKRGHNDFHNYDYATEADIVEAVRGELAKRNLMILPRVTRREAINVVRTTSKGDKSATLTYADMTFAIEDGDSGEVREFPWTGCGEDSGDKGIYKAMTGSEKYFLLKLFLIPTGDDPERDRRKGKTHGSVRNRHEPEPNVVCVTSEQANRVRNLIAETGISKTDAIREVQRVCGPNVTAAPQIPADKYEAVIAAIEKARPVTA